MYKRIQLIRRKFDVTDRAVSEFFEAFGELPKNTSGSKVLLIAVNINPMFPGNPLFHFIIESTHESLRDLQLFNTHPEHRDLASQYLDKNSDACIAEEHMTVVYEF